MKYVKRPVVIEATQWLTNGDHPDDDVFRPFEDTGAVPTVAREGAVVRYFRRPDRDGDARHVPMDGSSCDYAWDDHGWIDTLEGGHTVCPGDWIITGVAGERYPCKPGIFADTYDAAF